MKYANRIHNKHDRKISIRGLLLMLALMTSIAVPTLRPPVSHAQTSGTVVIWGTDFTNTGVLNVPAGLTNVTAISAGDLHSLALKSDGTVVGWGSNHFGEATPPVGLGNVVAISAGGAHSLALRPSQPTNRDRCKNGGWQTFTGPSFNNQGDCVSFVNRLNHGNN